MGKDKKWQPCAKTKFENEKKTKASPAADPYKYSEYPLVTESFASSAEEDSDQESEAELQTPPQELEVTPESDGSDDTDNGYQGSHAGLTPVKPDTPKQIQQPLPRIPEEKTDPKPDATPIGAQSDEKEYDPEITFRRERIIPEVLARGSEIRSDKTLEEQYKEALENIHLLSDSRDRAMAKAKTAEQRENARKNHAYASRLTSTLYHALSPQIDHRDRKRIQQAVQARYPPLAPSPPSSPVPARRNLNLTPTGSRTDTGPTSQDILRKRAEKLALKSGQHPQLPAPPDEPAPALPPRGVPRTPPRPQTRSQGGPEVPAVPDPEALLRLQRHRERQELLKKTRTQFP